MNQRIQQLALEAEVFAKQNNGDFHYFYTRKLSELIVRECVIISRTSADGFSAGRKMEEYFGVVE